ncbi:MAG: Sapep family Mn(2+)-dependent dipeptidase [Oscillospiraceae bacterium]|nr:Sapep family Mn(2+)-dependent dipeptidase [Oscillospiraceae bacterium]
MDKRINEYLQSKKDEFISDLRRLVEINSVRTNEKEGMPFGEGGAEALKEAAAILCEHSYTPTNFDNYALEADFGNAPEMMLLAHLDVVPEGDGWTKDPYKLTLEGDIAYGRGTTDDKGAAVACLYALDALRAIYGNPKTGVRLVLGSGEETGSEDMDHYFSKRPALKYTLSPDADYPLINIEKGRFAPFFKRTVKNEGSVKLISFDGGDTQNIVPSKASALVEGISAAEVKSIAEKISVETKAEFILEETASGVLIKANGVSAHAASPEKGNNAQTALIRLLAAMPLEGETKQALCSLDEVFPHGETNGENANLKLCDSVSGSLTLNFGVMSFNGSEFLCGTDLRCPILADSMDIKGIFAEKLSECGFTYVGSPEFRKAHYVSEDSELVKTCLRVYEEFTGNKGECLAIGGGTYVHDIDGGIAFGIEFPGRDYRIHGADEYADINELLLTAEMYAAVIKELCY